MQFSEESACLQEFASVLLVMLRTEFVLRNLVLENQSRRERAM